MARTGTADCEYAQQNRHEHEGGAQVGLRGDEHDALRETIRAFATKELAPHADEWEETTFPDWVFRRMGELGLLGLDKPERYGGQGGDYFTSLVLAEELVHARSGGMAMGVAVHTDMAMPPILAFGTEEQKQDWVVPAIAGNPGPDARGGAAHRDEIRCGLPGQP